ncbi:MAG TPA: hypothetical protein DER09_02225 [Prolixibacteraceae bacterium]|nr:hypothetical protein [Prolixibacteraceae bacterium]
MRKVNSSKNSFMLNFYKFFETVFLLLLSKKTTEKMKWKGFRSGSLFFLSAYKKLSNRPFS